MQNTMAGVFMAVRNLMNDDAAIADAIALATGRPIGDLNFDRNIDFLPKHQATHTRPWRRYLQRPSVSARATQRP